MAFVFRDRVSLQPRSIHVAALASIAIAQPLFDLLGRAPEFFLAHDLGPAEILAFVAILGVALPVACALSIAVVNRLHDRTAHAVASVMVAFFVTLVALDALESIAAGAWGPVLLGATVGTVFGVLYYRSAQIRTFVTWLAPAIVIVPLLFMSRSGVRSLVWPEEHEVRLSSKSVIPVVFVVFDGLPLTALLDQMQGIDRERYPSFAALADESTWYRNATTVSDYTQWAMPAILSGRYPNPRLLPIASDHAETLFTLLGSSHAFDVQEPISRLCPQSLCDHGGDGMAHELSSFAATLAVAYLHAILPEGFDERLPPIDQGWADGVPPSETPGEIWLRAGDRSRRGEAVAFINAIEADRAKPSLHFLHVLLPHIPLAYLPEGQRYGTERTLPGLLDTRDRWVQDEWAATQGYRKFLLQVGYVDTLLGQLMSRLKTIGLYDRALVVVTSDHGGSFKPAAAFRRLNDDTFADIVPVPLLIKEPHQRRGVTSDRNVETVDILPTIADLLGVDLPWKLDGISALGNAVPRKEKTVYYDNAKRVRRFPASLRDAIQESINRKIRLFGAAGNPHLIPRSSPRHDIIGRAVDDLPVSSVPDGIEFSLDAHGDFSDVDPESRFLPAQLSGSARWTDSRDPAVVAVAVNGIVRATTRTYGFESQGSNHAWTLLLPPDAFRVGENEVDVFVLRSSATPVLYRTQAFHSRPVDLLSNAASYGMRVTYEGFHAPERDSGGSRRWTAGPATVVVPSTGSSIPRSLRLNLATAGPVEKGLVVRVNGCEVFEGRVPAARWSKIFSLRGCADDAEATVVELRSRTHHEASSGRDLGIAVERLDLLKQEWPPASPLPDTDRQSQIRFVTRVRDGATVPSTQRLTVSIVNQGSSIWATPADIGQEDGAVRLGVLWFREGQTSPPVAVQRVELPHALVPGENVEFTFELVPMVAGQPLPPGQYDAWIGLLQEGVSWFYSSGDSVRKLRVVHDARP